MKARGTAEPGLFARAPRRATLGSWLRFAEGLYERSGVALGQVSASAHDEALYLLLRTLGLPLDSDAAVLGRVLGPAERAAVLAVLGRRITERVPAAYLTREAWLGGLRFHVDERVIIPRSYFVEIIPGLEGSPSRVADVCTGSGCLAILLARRFPRAKVTAVDLSAEALEVAGINVRAHRLSRRVSLHRSDVLDAVPAERYDLILSNPPYEPSAHCDALPPEFQREPRLALDGGRDGLDIIRRLVRQARTRLAPHGMLLIEVGGLRAAMDREFRALEPRWLPTEDGADCVCAIAAARLRATS
jgi:ribosomal protein L3 glutamine methyltransferase